MPWKGQKDPYKIWLSEIILQQTRVEQGWAYYLRFIKKYPNVTQLARAPEEEVFKLWEGLGYYNRCKNLVETARFIAENFKGRFPSTYEEIIALKGVGPYTAAAIASFAFNQPYAVVDGNVFRILSRYFGKSYPIDTGDGKNFFLKLASECLDKKEPGKYNQAIMDFGALVCKPVQPDCQVCPLRTDCVALNKSLVNKLPVKRKRLQKKKRWFVFYLLKSGNHYFIRKRRQKDIWFNLYELPLVEYESEKDFNDVRKNKAIFPGILKDECVSKTYSQALSHQSIKAKFIKGSAGGLKYFYKAFLPVPDKSLGKYAFPKIINEFLKDSGII